MRSPDRKKVEFDPREDARVEYEGYRDARDEYDATLRWVFGTARPPKQKSPSI